MTASTYHHGNLRADLLAAAEAALPVVGADGLSLRGLARDLGVSHAAPSRHFRDKQALLDALALDGFARLRAAMTAADRTSGDVRARLDAVARAYVRFAVEHDQLLALMYTAKHSPDAGQALRDAGDACLAVALGLVADGQRTGVLRDGDPAALATVLFAHVHGIALLASGGMLNDVPLDDVFAHSATMVWGGLRHADA